MVLAARLREELGLPGLTVAQTVPFRDKERMKQLLDAAGLRTPRHRATETVAGVWAAAEQVGYPLIVKPIDGAGSADTYRADSAAELDAILPGLRHVPRVSVEEFIDGEEFTYDTICAGGQVLVENICQYHPRPLQAKLHEWISPVTLALRDLDAPGLQGGRELGRAVLRALGFADGFTHMEWYRKADGEVVFGEIGARPPGARTVDVMNYATDADLFTAWAHAVTQGSIPFAGRAALQRGQHLQAGPRGRPDHPLRRPGPPAGGVRRARRRDRPAPGGRAPAGLAGHPDRRRHGDRPPPRPGPGPGDGPAVRRRPAPVRGGDMTSISQRRRPAVLPSARPTSSGWCGSRRCRPTRTPRRTCGPAPARSPPCSAGPACPRSTWSPPGTAARPCSARAPGRPAPRTSCCTRTTTCSRRATPPTGTATRSSPPNGTAGSTAAAPPTTRPASRCTWPRSVLRAFADGLPVGVTVLVEGEEEIGSPALRDFLAAYADRLRADVVVFADAGNWSLDVPALTTTLRGGTNVVVEVRTLDHGLHSGMYGGPVPDALTALCRLLATLHDEHGDVAVPGLVRGPSDSPDLTEEQFRAEAGLLDGVRLTGTGRLADRLSAGPAVTVIGIDAPPVATASNTLVPVARAKVSLRVAPGDDAAAARDALAAHLHRPRAVGCAGARRGRRGGRAVYRTHRGDGRTGAPVRPSRRRGGRPAVRRGRGRVHPLRHRLRRPASPTPRS